MSDGPRDSCRPFCGEFSPVKEMREFLRAFLTAAGIQADIDVAEAGRNAVFTIRPRTETDASRAIGSGGSTAKALRKLVEYAGQLRGVTFKLDVDGSQE